MNKIILGLVLLGSLKSFSQGNNHVWLLGNQHLISVPKARAFIDSTSFIFNNEFRKMTFEDTEATICDENGNFLMSSNGIWVANANNDTMLNGSGLNPGIFANSWPWGFPLPYGNLIFPYPGDTNKFVLFHKTILGPDAISPKEIFNTIIDITMDGGLGAVTIKNDSVLTDTLNWGMTACKHANGRDWWIVVMADGSDIAYKILFSVNGVLNVSTQSLQFGPNVYGNVSQITFSQDGSKLIYSVCDTPQTNNCSIILADFDRCTGTFSNSRKIPLTNGNYIWGQAFSSSGNYIYACTSINIFQIDTGNLSVDTVTTYDGFISGIPPTCCPTTFFNMYLGANGKIYITSGSTVQHIHEMNFPDSIGVSCDLQQHAVNTGIFFMRSVPNHPNYYLGPIVGSVCDSLTGMNEHLTSISNFQVKPNPNNGNFNISYLLPQNKPGCFEVFDVNGRKVYTMPLPRWSTLQQIKLPKLSSGIYNAFITSAGYRVSKKIAVVTE